MRTLKIYFTSDIHGYFYPTSYDDMQRKNIGLFACAHGFQKDENTLLIDGGDVLQGSAFAYYCSRIKNSPKAIAEIMNDCGYDYYTLGNHDFNYGQNYQTAYCKEHHGKCVCQNVEDTEGNTLYPYDIRIMPNGLRVGIVGLVTDYVNIWEKEEHLEGIQITDPFSAAKRALDALKEKVDITICVYHGGFEKNVQNGKILSETTENIGYRICKELDFDILLTGHQHMTIEGQYCHGTYTLQPAENASEYYYLEVRITGGKKEICSNRFAADCDSTELSSELENKYMLLEEEIQHWLKQPMGHLNRALLPDQKIKMALHGTPIADLLNTIQLYYSKAQISAAGLANEIPGFRKEVCVRDIISMYPYPNTLVVCEISGQKLRAAMERSAEYFAISENGEICVAESFLVPKVEHYNYDYYMGVTYEIEPSQPVGQRIQKLCYQGKKVEDTDCFTICINNYRYSGAGNYPMYQECRVIKEINIEMVELIMEYFHQNPYIEI